MPERNPALRRVVVTGIGGVTPAGSIKEFSNDPDGPVVKDGPFWDNVTSGKSFITAVKIGAGYPFETMELGGDLSNLDETIKQYVHPGQIKNAPSHSRQSLVAGVQAGLDSGLLTVVQRAIEKQHGFYALDKNLDPGRFAIQIAIAVGGDKAIEEAVRTMMTLGLDKVSARTIPMLNPNNATAGLARLIGVYEKDGDKLDPEAALFLEGDSPTFACTSGAKSIWNVYRDIAYGEADAGMAGATEDPLHPVPYIGFHKAGLKGVLAKYNRFMDDPSKASRPFDRDREGLVIGKAAGVIVLEELEHAKRRGAKIYAELVGGCFMMNANHTLEPSARVQAKIIERALAWGGLTPDQLEYLNAHAAGTIGDTREDESAKMIAGSHLDRFLMSSSKSIFSHLMGAAGVIEAIATIKALETGIIPPTVNLDNAEDPDIDHVANEARKKRVILAGSASYGLEGTYGFLGFRSADAIRKAA